MTETPLAELTRIAVAGNRNAGKSSLVNAIFQNDVSIVSSVPGTTTDPVTKRIELGRLGMCAVTDTAGIDDEGSLGLQRVEKTAARLLEADLVLFVSPGDRPPSDSERKFLSELNGRKAVFLGVLTFSDRPPDPEKSAFFPQGKFVRVCAALRTGGRKSGGKDAGKTHGAESAASAESAAATAEAAATAKSAAKQGAEKADSGIGALLEKIEGMASLIQREMTPVEGIVREQELVMLVTPVDLAAPAGRLILPQVETIRDLLDRDCAALIVKERELRSVYESLGRRPDLVITDSQAFSKVAADIPEDQRLTSFSILFARKKGDPAYFIRSLRALERFPRGGRVLIMEACSHHRQADDLGTVKIPRLFRQLVDAGAVFEHTRVMPEKPEDYSLVIHCAACMISQRAMGVKLDRFKAAGVPVLNYGMFLAWANGLMPRALEPFPDLVDAWRES